ncbi:MAG: 4Fe-4S cluster-binding domain-containing protein [Oscillospiraceae bacterium]|nr:4Fe-4S cluster-binding domain-containing protein [Oscillospiraceae bacterium]
MSKGIIFDIKEAAVHDGPGLRVTVFLKGCPMRCAWCHNPEGLLPVPQAMRSSRGCAHCGKCSRLCSHPECAGLGVCARICPNGLVRVAGGEIDSADLAARLLMDARDRATVEILPYNTLAGAKYAAVGMSFAPTYDESHPAAYYLDELKSAGLNTRML